MKQKDKVYAVIKNSPFGQMTLAAIIKSSGVGYSSATGYLCDLITEKKLTRFKTGREAVYKIGI